MSNRFWDILVWIRKLLSWLIFELMEDVNTRFLGYFFVLCGDNLNICISKYFWGDIIAWF